MASINEVRNKDGILTGYRFRTCVGRDEFGKQIWRSETIDLPKKARGKTYYETAQELATTWEKEQIEEYKRNVPINREKLTLSQFIHTIWMPLTIEDGSRTPSTVAFYKNMAAPIEDFFGEHVRVADIDIALVKKFITFLNNKATTKAGNPYTGTTKQHIVKTLQTIFDDAKRYHYIEQNPCDDLKAKEIPQKEKKDVDFLDAEEARIFVSCLEEEPIFWKCLLTLLIQTGLRRGEAVGLQWGDISQNGLVINISRNVTIDTKSPDKIHIGETKTKQTRKVPITRQVYSLLMELKAEQTQRLGMIPFSTAFVFCKDTDPHSPIYPTSPTKYMQRFCKRHGIRDVSPHDLRHSAATLALMGGADIKQVQTLLGHSDSSVTMDYYLGITEKQQQQTAEAIERILTAK